MGSCGYYSSSLYLSVSLKQKEKNSKETIDNFLKKYGKKVSQRIDIENDNDVIEEYFNNGYKICLELIKDEDDDDDKYEDYENEEDCYIESTKYKLKEFLEILEEWDERDFNYLIYIMKKPEASFFEYLNLNIIEKYKFFDIDTNTLKTSIEIGENSGSLYGGNSTENTIIDLSKYADLLSLPNLEIQLSTSLSVY